MVKQIMSSRARRGVSFFLKDFQQLLSMISRPVSNTTLYDILDLTVGGGWNRGSHLSQQREGYYVINLSTMKSLLKLDMYIDSPLHPASLMYLWSNLPPTLHDLSIASKTNSVVIDHMNSNEIYKCISHLTCLKCLRSDSIIYPPSVTSVVFQDMSGGRLTDYQTINMLLPCPLIETLTIINLGGIKSRALLPLRCAALQTLRIYMDGINDHISNDAFSGLDTLRSLTLSGYDMPIDWIFLKDLTHLTYLAVDAPYDHDETENFSRNLPASIVELQLWEEYSDDESQSGADDEFSHWDALTLCDMKAMSPQCIALNKVNITYT
jgi:hypothetical protein